MKECRRLPKQHRQNVFGSRLQSGGLRMGRSVRAIAGAGSGLKRSDKVASIAYT